MTEPGNTLVLGWGNPGRLDDGLGPAFVETLAAMQLPSVVLDSDYQLTVEDAADVARFRRVLFVDADREAAGPFTMRRLRPSRDGSSFTTHSVSPGAVLALSRDLFGSTPEAWVLGIRGYEFDEFGERLSRAARVNLDRAAAYVRAAFESNRFHETNHEDEPCPTTSR